MLSRNTWHNFCCFQRLFYFTFWLPTHVLAPAAPFHFPLPWPGLWPARITVMKNSSALGLSLETDTARARSAEVADSQPETEHAAQSHVRHAYASAFGSETKERSYRVLCTGGK